MDARSLLDDQVALTTFRKPRMAALCLLMTLHDQGAFTTYNIPLVRVGVTLHDQVAFTTLGGQLFANN